jgi:hypothetical protein
MQKALAQDGSKSQERALEQLGVQDQPFTAKRYGPLPPPWESGAKRRWRQKVADRRVWPVRR